jgi:hypothetical protein
MRSAEIPVDIVASDLAETLYYSGLEWEKTEEALEQGAWQRVSIEALNTVCRLEGLSYLIVDAEYREAFQRCRESYLKEHATTASRFGHLPAEVAYRANEIVFGLPAGTYGKLLAQIVERAVTLTKKMHLRKRN